MIIALLLLILFALIFGGEATLAVLKLLFVSALVLAGVGVVGVVLFNLLLPII